MENICWTDRVRNEKKKIFSNSQGGEEYPTYNEKKEDQLDWSHLT